MLIKIRLKENLGIQSTFSKIKVDENWTVPMWVTFATSPLGNLTEIWTVEVMDVKSVREWTIWSVTPLSRIQSVDVIGFLKKA